MGRMAEHERDKQKEFNQENAEDDQHTAEKEFIPLAMN